MLGLAAAGVGMDGEGKDCAMAVEAVLFDYHDTLFRFEGDDVWLRAGAHACGMTMTDPQVRALAVRIDEARRLPEVLTMGQGRDLSPEAHRRATTGWLRLAGLAEPLVDALYERLVTPVCWQPFADAAPVIRGLCHVGIAVGVLSNTGWDLRETFVHYGLRQYVTAFTLSSEIGLQKPASAIFKRACADLGADPGATLMVGDNPGTDGGCVAAGLPAYLMPPVRDSQVRGLSAVLRLADVTNPRCGRVPWPGCGER
jgi:FMN phosphatase YigB (HAD superfamily)